MGGTATRVLKNSGYLYMQMLYAMFVSLFSTRLILNGLGASDFGIYTIVGGAIGMLGFLNGAMSSATQRFMSYAEGAGDFERKKIVFNVSIILHIFISTIVVVFLIIFGFIYFNGLLNLPSERRFAAIIVYCCMTICTIMMITNVPYVALINAHENMRYYSIVGFIETTLKLLVALACFYLDTDRLILYGVLMMLLTSISWTIMKIFCHKNYEECVFSPRLYWRNDVMKEMTSFAGWSFLSSSTGIILMQSVSFILNYFFGVLSNAAQGIANQLSGQIMVFSNTMLSALNPVIVKSEGASDRKKMLEASMSGSKLSYLILAFIAIPFCVETPYILKIWLKEVPDYAIIFCRLILIRLLITQLTVTLGTAIGATGKMKGVTVYTSLTRIITVILAIVLYKFKAPIYTIYILLIFMTIIITWSNLYYAKQRCDLKISEFLNKVFVPCLLISFTTTLICTIPQLFIEPSLIRLLMTGCLSVLTFVLLFYKYGLSTKEKTVLIGLIESLRIKYNSAFNK